MLTNQIQNKIHKDTFCGKIAYRAWGELFASAYLILMFGAYPFYMEQGYVDIGEAKYRFFIYCSLAAAGILGVIGGIHYIQVLRQRGKRHEPYLVRWENLSVTDLFVIMYATGIFISYVLSDYRKEALWGTEGWHIGLIPLLVLCALYFLISRLWDGRAFVWYVSMAASAAVFLLGILDRFSVYLIPLEIRQPDFISTLGNINWFCGYLTVLAPIGVYIFLFLEEDEENGSGIRHGGKVKKWLAGAYVVIAFMAGFSQGSSSIFIFFGVLFYILLWKAVEKRKWLADWCLLVCLWGMSAQLVRGMRFLLPEGYNYDADNLCAYLTDSNVTLLVGIAAFILYAWIKKYRFAEQEDDGEKIICEVSKESKAETARKARIMYKASKGYKIKMIRRLMGVALAAGILCWFGLTCFHTWKNTPDVTQTSLFLFDENWGNGRGAALKAGVQMFTELPLEKKVFGVGPDCFSAYAYSLPETAMSLRENFGGDRLTNAHNELLTGLINTGITGVTLYLGIFVSYIIRHIKKGTLFSHAAIVCILCYLLHNMVSFAQVLNLPFVFLIMAMGERQEIE